MNAFELGGEQIQTRDTIINREEAPLPFWFSDVLLVDCPCYTNISGT